MKKASKTQTSQQLVQSMNVNSSLQSWCFNNKYQHPKKSLHGLSQCNSCGQSLSYQFAKQPFQPITNQQSQSIYSKAPLTPVQKHIIMIPDVTKSISQHKEGSKLSLQLNQISMGFNKQNKRIQQALFEIRESTVKKQNQRYLRSISLSKKSQTSKKSNKYKIDQSIVKVLNFQNLTQQYKKKQHNRNKQQNNKKQNNNKKDLFTYNANKQQKSLLIKQSAYNNNKIKKKNLYQLMKQQKNMIKTLGSNLRSP